MNTVHSIQLLIQEGSFLPRLFYNFLSYIFPLCLPFNFSNSFPGLLVEHMRLSFQPLICGILIII